MTFKHSYASASEVFIAFEGQRRFDLVRTHKLKEAMMAQNPTIGAVVEEKHYLLPIPVTELDANKLLEQTPGW